MSPTQRSGKRELRKRERKERIYQAAMELFRRQGFEATRVSEITRAAGVGKGTFFNYFPAKEDVLLYIGQRQLSRLGTAFLEGDGMGAPRDSGVGALKDLLRMLARSLEADRELVRLAVENAMKITQLAAGADDERFSFSSLAAILITRAQRQGEIHPSLDPEAAAQIVEGLYYQQLVLWCRQDFAFDLGERLTQIVDLLLVGIGVRQRSP